MSEEEFDYNELATSLNAKLGGDIVKTGVLKSASDIYGYVSSGSTVFDAVMGGGFPLGRIVEIFGPESQGKTSLATIALANLQKGLIRFTHPDVKVPKIRIANLLDAEFAFDKLHGKRLGIKMKSLLLSHPEHLEEGFDCLAALLSKVLEFEDIELDDSEGIHPELIWMASEGGVDISSAKEDEDVIHMIESDFETEWDKYDWKSMEKRFKKLCVKWGLEIPWKRKKAAKVVNTEGRPLVGFVWDTIASSPPLDEVSAKDLRSLKGGMTSKPRAIRRALRKYTSIIAKARALALFINQIYTGPTKGPGKGPNENTQGGGGLKSHSSARLRISRRQFITNEHERNIGIWIKITAKKSKICPPNFEVLLPFYWDYGIDDYQGIERFFGKDTKYPGVIKTSGSWKSIIGFGKKLKWQNINKFKSLVEEEPGFADYLKYMTWKIAGYKTPVTKRMRKHYKKLWKEAV